MEKIRINTSHHNTVSFNGETCTFIEAGLFSINSEDNSLIEKTSMLEIVEHFLEKDAIENENEVIFEIDLTDLEGNSRVMDVTLENGCICIWDNGVDVTENYNINGWTRNENGEYTI